MYNWPYQLKGSSNEKNHDNGSIGFVSIGM
ncbi:Uncharacterised protein [Providencia rettgeri]|nr:Uncharacterised protein [Providencia rettgeri]CAC9150213.1 Uncharacterised protein [Providencia rettgeri]